jgi:hypothetical protein
MVRFLTLTAVFLGAPRRVSARQARVPAPQTTLALLLLSAGALHGSVTFSVAGTDAAAWSRLFTSVGMEAASPADAQVLVINDVTTELDWANVRPGVIVVLEGAGPAAAQAGVARKGAPVAVRRIIDVHAPEVEIVWAQAEVVPAVTLDPDYRVFAKDRWSGTPVVAGRVTPQGAVLWLATSPGAAGIEHFPYVLQALADLGLTFPAKSTSLWAFFDSSYRSRADLNYLAARWRRSGIAALHVAAWHNMEPDADRDAFLRGLIAACHRNAILVYAWIELPHVSDQFWADHPEWREKTAAGQDAQLDWRKLMNLQNPACRKAVATGLDRLLERFDWDGVNLAELYFESLEGAANPARFTPMNDDVRRMFQSSAGFDPRLLFDPASEYAASRAPAGLRRFLDFRRQLATDMQVYWMDFASQKRGKKPWLDIVLTHIDDRFDEGIRDSLGADVARALPMAQTRRIRVLVEDPAPLWNLGAERYTKLAVKYAELNTRPVDLAVDINVVDRYQDVYPTKKQTGAELVELVHAAAASFDRVALYFESSIEKQDLALLPVAANLAKVRQPDGHITDGATDGAMEVESPQPSRVMWSGPVELDGQPWPIEDKTSVLVPAGKHKLRPGVSVSPVHVTDFNGDIRMARMESGAILLAYRNQTRAIATIDAAVSSVEVDGNAFWRAAGAEPQFFFVLPQGQHVVTFRFEASSVKLAGVSAPMSVDSR